MHALRVILAAAALSSSAFATSSAAPIASTTDADAIVFSRTLLNPDATARSSGLFITDPGGSVVRPLVPMVDGVFNVGPTSWSPQGDRIVFARGRAARGRVVDRYNLFIVKREGGRLHKLTTGPGSHHSPAWGPGSRIAFVSEYADHQCLSIIDADGRHQRNLLCLPNAGTVMRPQWSANGASLYVSTGHYLGRLEPIWQSQAYRVNAASGVATLLTEQVFNEVRYLEFAPDGRHGIYSDIYVNEMTIVDFATDEQIPLAFGYAPRYSWDGSRIAFTQDVFGGPPDFLYYQPLFMMDADGSNVRRLTNAQVNNLEYTIVDWSRDGTHVLVNRRIFIDPALTISRTALRIINVNTGAVRRLPDGHAGPGAWFEE